MKKILLVIFLLMVFAGVGSAADQRIQYTEEMVGAGHPTKSDTLNRLSLVEHNTDGTHKMTSGVAGDIFYHDGTKLTRLAKGSLGQVLRQNNALTAPEWVSARESLWTPVTAFTATPASTSTLTMTSDLTGSIQVGMSLRYVIGGTTYYGRVAAIESNLLTVNGAPLSDDVTSLAYGGGRITQIVVIIPGTYEDASNTSLISSDLNSSLIWDKEKAYCVYYRVYSKTHDSGTHGQASVRINSTEVNTTTDGLTIAADATWYSTVVDIDVAAYDVNPGEAIEVTTVKNGNGDATNLTVEMIFVTP